MHQMLHANFVGSGKGAAMVACVAERNFSGIFVDDDKETAEYETMSASLIN